MEDRMDEGIRRLVESKCMSCMSKDGGLGTNTDGSHNGQWQVQGGWRQQEVRLL